jgi:hypothetical protein
MRLSQGALDLRALRDRRTCSWNILVQPVV